ncbi:universal stress protein [Mycolicibacterium sp. CH28]|uniref:universal stress protein n=1 Tax=Mycolicibacterium sp. CH28 TaxID=2512237 RepID=UPI0010800C0E|nr:universal stress protein [Mycolicibacterium sp. CH28]TGD85372.1 universal stress protein [Mycolicibacterium sp. CH28]
MTVIVGYLAGKSGTAPLHLGLGAARTLRTSLTVATIVPKPWTTPSPARIDAEYAAWADQLAADSAAEARRYLATVSDAPTIGYHSHAHRSVSGGLVEVVEELQAELLVLGSSANGQLGQVVVGSTADRMLHSSPVPVAIAPRGYRGARSGRLTRITCAFPGTPEGVHVVKRVADLAKQFDVPLRVITFAVRGRTMYPPEVGLHAEDSILAAWETHARELLAQMSTDGVVGDDTVLQVVSGNGWDQALDAAEWEEGEVLALGTSPRGDIARVFLGSRGSKIMRHSPVPVLVMPG